MKNPTETQYSYFSEKLHVRCDPLSRFIESCDLTLKAFDWQYGLEHTTGPRIYGDMELIYVMSGESIITLNNVEYCGHEGDMFVIRKHSLCRIDTNPKDPHENYWMHLDVGDEVAEKQLENLLGGPLLHLGKDRQLLEYYHWMDAYYTIGGSGSYLCIKSCLHLILCRIVQLLQQQENTSPFLIANQCDDLRDLLRICIQKIHESRGNITVAKLCEQMYVSPSYLRQVFRTQLGESPSSFIRSVRIREAEKQLMITDLPISAIAAQLGYASPYHFTNDFRKNNAITPTEYRKTHRKLSQKAAGISMDGE